MFYPITAHIPWTETVLIIYLATFVPLTVMAITQGGAGGQGQHAEGGDQEDEGEHVIFTCFLFNYANSYLVFICKDGLIDRYILDFR